MNTRACYLRDVLGVESWIQASPLASPLVALFKSTWTTAEKVLAEKILFGVGLQDCPVAYDNAISSASVVVFDSVEMPSRVEQDGRIFWNLGPIKMLLEGSASEIQNAKREVWNLLKLLKQESGA